MKIRSYEDLGIEKLAPMTFREVWGKYVKLPKDIQITVRDWALSGMDREKELEICQKWAGHYMVAPNGAHIVIEKDSIQAIG